MLHFYSGKLLQIHSGVDTLRSWRVLDGSRAFPTRVTDAPSKCNWQPWHVVLMRRCPLKPLRLPPLRL